MKYTESRNISGENNPNWKGGLVNKVCEVCNASYSVKRVHSGSRFCSSACFGKSQVGVNKTQPKKRIDKICVICGTSYSVNICHSDRLKTCSSECSRKYISNRMKGENNPAWEGGLSMIPYPYNWPEISKAIRNRDGNACMNPKCDSTNNVIVVHHIDYNKTNCDPKNLITVCSKCNLSANIGRDAWYLHYMEIQYNRGISLDVVMPKLIKETTYRKGENHQMAKLTNQDVYEIRSFLSIFKSKGIKTRIAEMFGVTPSSISNIFNKKSWV